MANITPFPISVILVASNEEQNLPRCLSSVAGWVSEIVVVLNNSTDRSEQIAQEYGARIERSAWLGFRDTKNVALSFASQPWVLNLDADEEVSPALREEIAAFFQRGESERFTGVSFPRKVFFLGRWITHGDWYPDRVLRLFRRETSRFEGSYGHDHVSVQGAIKKLRADLHHYSYPTINSHVLKINSFADAFLRQQIEDKKKWSPIATIARPLWRFFRAYVLKRGFLDGFPGLYIAWATAFATFVRYSRLYEHEHRKPLHSSTDNA